MGEETCMGKKQKQKRTLLQNIPCTTKGLSIVLTRLFSWHAIFISVVH